MPVRARAPGAGGLDASGRSVNTLHIFTSGPRSRARERAFKVAERLVLPFTLGTIWQQLIVNIESMLPSALLLSFFILKPRGIIQEKKLRIPGINYRELVLNPDGFSSSRAPARHKKTRET